MIVALHDRLFADRDPGPLLWAPEAAHPSAVDVGVQGRFELLSEAALALQGAPVMDRAKLCEDAVEDLARRDPAFGADRATVTTFLLCAAAHEPCPPGVRPGIHTTWQIAA